MYTRFRESSAGFDRGDCGREAVSCRQIADCITPYSVHTYHINFFIGSQQRTPCAGKMNEISILCILETLPPPGGFVFPIAVLWSLGRSMQQTRHDSAANRQLEVGFRVRHTCANGAKNMGGSPFISLPRAGSMWLKTN